MKKLQRKELPQYTVTLPVSKMTVTYQPYTIKEERILDLAGSTEDPIEKYKSVKQIISTCTDIKDVGSLCSADFDYMFIKLYSISESGKFEFTYNNQNCTNEDCPDTLHGVFDLEKNIVIDNLDNMDKYSTEYKDKSVSGRIVDLVDDYKLILSMSMLDNLDEDIDISKLVYDILIGVIDGEDIHYKEDLTFEEFKDFFESFRPTELGGLQDYVNNLPVLVAKTKVRCPKCGAIKDINQKGLISFLV